MRRPLLFVLVALTLAIANPARAQFCPGAAPWVFDDVPAADPFCGYITWAAQNGITLAAGHSSVVAGGYNNAAAGIASQAGGYFANANYDGCYVWGDLSTSNTISCNSPNRYVVRSLGGVFFFAGGSTQATYSGVVLPPGGTAWVVASDRNIKENVVPVDREAVLARVLDLPIATWNLKTQHRSIRHMGAMAQDFRAAFGLGESDVGINTIDADGVALAAIQGLNAKLETKIREQAQEIAALHMRYSSEIAEIKAAVEVLMARTASDTRVAAK